MTYPMSRNIAQVGCGYWGKNLLRNFAELGALAAVVDHDAELTTKAALDYGVPARSFEDVLGDDSIRGIALATPAPTHAALAEKALLAGKHVFVEKPVALRVADAEHVQSIAKERGLVLMVGHLLQYHPIFLALKDLVQAGELGEIRFIYSNRLSLGKFRVQENVLWSFAPHDISMVLALAGGEIPEHVSAQGAAFLTPGVADWCSVQMAFATGIQGHVTASWLHPFKEQRLTVIGSKAMAVFEDSKPDWDQRLALYRHAIAVNDGVPSPVAAPAEYVEVAKGEPLKNECSHFLDCIRTGETPKTDGQEGIRVLNVLERAQACLGPAMGV
jgi:predicted dehydrogenase